MVASVRSGRRTLNPCSRSTAKACGVVTSCARCRSMYRTAGVSAVSGTTMCRSQILSYSVRMRGSDGGSHPRLRLHVDVVEPVVFIGGAAIKQTEEGLLQAFGDWPAPAGANLDAIDRADRRDLYRRAAEEQLIGQVQQLARHRHLTHFYAPFAGQADNGIARDPGQPGMRQSRRQ